MPRVLKTDLVALAWFSHFYLQAQDHIPFPEPINYLDAVAIDQVQRYQETLPSLVIESADIKRFAPLNVADVLHYCAGVQVKDYGGIGGIKTINIHSMGSQHSGIFYDGFALGNAQNGQIDLGQLSMENVTRISIYQGQRSSIFQSAGEFGHASTVYISTSPYLFDSNGSNQTQTRIKVQGGSSDFQRLSVSQRFALSPSLSATYHIEEQTASGKYRFRYRRRNYDGSVAYDTTATRQNGDVQALLAEVNLYYDRAHDNARLKGYTYLSNRGIPGAIVNNVWRGGERQRDNNTFLQGQWTHEFTEQYCVKAKAKFAHYGTHYVNNDSTRYLTDNTFQQNEAYLSLCQAWDNQDNLSLSSSYDYTWNNLHSDLPLFQPPLRHSHQLSLAAAASSLHLRSQVSLLGSVIHDIHGDQQTYFRQLTPAFYLRWMSRGPNNGLSVHTFVKKCFRMPTFNDLYYTDMGNAALKPEKAWLFDIGTQYSRSWGPQQCHSISMFFDLYHHRVSHKIVAYPKGQQFRWTMLNLGKVDINGLDLNLGYRYLRRRHALRLDLQYTAQQAIDVTDSNNSYYRDQIPYMPRHSGSLTAGYEQGSWSVNYHFTYVGERWSQQENIRYNHLQPWYTSDLNVQFAWERYHIVAEVLNLLDQQYDVIANYPMPGRNYRFTLCATF